MPDHEGPIIEFNQIDDYIFVGTNSCCQMHFDEKLLSLGILADVSLEQERIDSPFGVESFLWLPTVDHTAPALDQLQLGVQHLQTLARQKKKVYVHCKNGHGRGPTLVAAYYIAGGMSPADAIALILEKREGAHLETSQKEALNNFKTL